MTRIGLFGLLGSGNLGNDGSLEAALRFLSAEHPDAHLSVLCGGPELVKARYGVEAQALNWFAGEYLTVTNLRSLVLKGLGKVVDVFRTARWVWRQDLVLVPGMGVLEATVHLRPWGFPYSLLLLTASGRLLGRKVALLNVGAEVINQPATRFVFRHAAGLASYRSYRDELSRDAMSEIGIDTSKDEIHPDIVFALPVPNAPVTPGAVGVGVMAFRGRTDERPRAEEIYRSYVDSITRFVHHLVDTGRSVRLFIGDQLDTPVVDEILAECGPRVSASKATSLDGVMREMAGLEAVVATRYHNVLCALKVRRPTISIGYAGKSEALMAGMGMGEFTQSLRELDVDRLIEQFRALEDRADEITAALEEQVTENEQRLKRQLAGLSAGLLRGKR